MAGWGDGGGDPASVVGSDGASTTTGSVLIVGAGDEENLISLRILIFSRSTKNGPEKENKATIND